MNFSETLIDVEMAGAVLRLDGDKIKVWYPDSARRRDLAGRVALLRQHRTELAKLLTERTSPPIMPEGVRLVSWNLKVPPVCLETYSVVIDTGKFAKSTLTQMQTLLVDPKAKVGWTIEQLVERLAQVGAIVVLESELRARDR